MEGSAPARRGDRHTGRQRPALSADPSEPSRSLWVFCGILVALILARPSLSVFLGDQPALATWLTVFVSICLQALPFLVFGVLMSAAIATFVSPSALARILPRHPAAAVPVAALGGTVLPGCECASVPVAGALVRRGLRPAVALTFLLAAPAVNPIVLVSTAVAFPGQPRMVLARFLASLFTAMIVGWVWLAWRRDALIRMRARHQHDGRKADVFVAEARHDLLQAGGFLALGAAVAASVNIFAPREMLATIAGNPVVAVLFLAGLAVVVAICSEADAFVAASMSQFSPVAQLAFMVVGPALDVKLFAMQVGVFGRRFALVFAPLTLLSALAATAAVGWWLL